MCINCNIPSCVIENPRTGKCVTCSDHRYIHEIDYRCTNKRSSNATVTATVLTGLYVLLRSLPLGQKRKWPDYINELVFLQLNTSCIHGKLTVFSHFCKTSQPTYSFHARKEYNCLQRGKH